jgi:hypothetical protein
MRQRAALFGTVAAAVFCLVAPDLPALAHGGHEHGEHGASEAIYGRPGKAQDVKRTITLIATEMRAALMRSTPEGRPYSAVRS